MNIRNSHLLISAHMSRANMILFKLKDFFFHIKYKLYFAFPLADYQEYIFSCLKLFFCVHKIIFGWIISSGECFSIIWTSMTLWLRSASVVNLTVVSDRPDYFVAMTQNYNRFLYWAYCLMDARSNLLSTITPYICLSLYCLLQAWAITPYICLSLPVGRFTFA